MKHKEKILLYLSEGFSSKEIAKKVGISHRTVETYLYNLRFIADAKNTTHLVALWLKGKFK